ncbi:MAG: hypothetical protein KJO75_07955 [Dactylosporangium sp.]|nr:hypothetical protein [Dactylosporangium sp.]
MGEEESWTWSERRRHAIERHAAAHAQQRAAEVEQARALVAEFVRDAGYLGLAVVRLVASPYNGKAKYYTRLRGWYVHPNRSLAVATDGLFYRLIVPASFRARLLGVTPEPDDPPLIVGAGGRDGESIPLRDLLRRRLGAADIWP